MTNAEWIIKQGIKFSDLGFMHFTKTVRAKENGAIEKENITQIVAWEDNDSEPTRVLDEFGTRALDFEDVVPAWLDMEHKERPILDKAEKRYLRNFLKPLNVSNLTVEKTCISTQGCEFLTAEYKGIMKIYERTTLPEFRAGEMYKGMKLGKRYTPEELGLWEKGSKA